MKFGKNIARVVALSDPEWAPFWVNYKYLKKKIKSLEAGSGSDSGDASTSNHEAIAKSAGEVAFFKLVRQELRKCSEFFTSVEAQFVVRRFRVQEGLKQLQATDIVQDGDPHNRLMAACVKLYKDLLLLENYAIMNYCGFSKILKKHDKITRFQTRERFMKNVANGAPFVQYPQLIELLTGVEKLFNEIQCFSNARSIPIATTSEEQLFIDAMRSINTEASRLQQEESADIGTLDPDFSERRSRRLANPSALSSGSPGPGPGQGAANGARGGVSQCAEAMGTGAGAAAAAAVAAAAAAEEAQRGAGAAAAAGAGALPATGEASRGGGGGVVGQDGAGASGTGTRAVAAGEVLVNEEAVGRSLRDRQANAGGRSAAAAVAVKVDEPSRGPPGAKRRKT